MTTKSEGIVETVLANAASAGIVSTESQQVIATQFDDIALAGCDGVDAEDIDSEEVTLVCVTIDASYSMDSHRNEVIKSYNEMFLRPLQGAKNKESILVSLWVFSAETGEYVRLVHGYTPVADCPQLTPSDYAPDGGTPLNDAAHRGMSGLLLYGQTLRDSGTRTKSIMVVMSDGEENSSKLPATKVRTLSEDVLRSQEFVLSYIFFGSEADGDKYAKKLGFPPQHRLTSDLDDSGIRRVMRQVSASVITTSQTKVSAGSISQNAFFLDIDE